ncbi:MAG TPA: ROK family protein [Jiangellaceae bacterium]|nr:ROK family protein [Jiangellaceae bacterium]
MSASQPIQQRSLRQHNLAVVARTVVDAAAPLSRAGVAAATGLTRGTVSALVDRLLAAGILIELPPARQVRAGRPAVPLAPARRTIVGLGLEVNVDYLGARIVDLTGDTVDETVVPGDFHGSDPGATLARLGELARDLVDRAATAGLRVAGARLALPGLVETQSSRLRIAPNLGWSDLEPRRLIGLPDAVPVTVANEAKLAALAQVWGTPGAERTARTFLYVSGDVGVGAAIVVDDQLFAGRHGWSGEIGHVVVDPSGPRCRCGATGCLERYAGKEALVAAVGLGVDAPDVVVAERLGAADPAAAAVVRRTGTALGRAIANAVNLIDVDTVLLGGVYAAIAPLLQPGIGEELAVRVLGAPWAPVTVRAAPVADRAALTGGALAVLRGVVDDPTPWLS